MKQRAVVLLAACAVLFSAASASALTPGTCADFEGKWSFTYDNSSKNDNITITSICSKPTPSSATPACMPTGSVQDSWLCVARGYKGNTSDNKTVQIRQISMDTANFAYYEATDAEILAGGQNTPYDFIPTDNFTKCAFKSSGDNFGLASGAKDNCTDNDTPPVDNCTLEKIIPGRISKLTAILSPITPFVIIGSGDPEFARGDKAAFDSDAIKPLIQLRISKKIIIAISLVRPFKLAPGEVEVTVGDCVGSITVK